MDTELTAPSDDSFASHRLGAMLGEARKAAGLDLADIARDTRVPLRHLTAIEHDAHDSLPALPYTIGFVKSFARAVGVDPEAAAAQFRAETSKTAHVPAAPAMAPLDERRLPPRGLVTLSIVGVLAIVAGVVAYSAGMFDRAVPNPTQVAAVPEPAAAPPADVVPDVAPATTPAATTTPAPATTMPTPTPTPLPATPTAAMPTPAATGVATGPSRVSITASEDAWYRISGFDPAVGKVVTVKTAVLAKGERYDIPATPGLKLWTGRAGALRVSVDGRALPPLGGPVETIKNVSLDAPDLLARAAAPATTGSR